MDIEKIKEAKELLNQIECLEFGHGKIDDRTMLEIAIILQDYIDLATAVVEAGEYWPGKKKQDNLTQPWEWHINQGWNSALDSCLAHVAAKFADGKWITKEQYKAGLPFLSDEIDYLKTKLDTCQRKLKQYESGEWVKPPTGKEIFDLIRCEEWFCKSRIPTHEDINNTSHAIHEAMVKGGNNAK
jgi:hypothetical protein